MRLDRREGPPSMRFWQGYWRPMTRIDAIWLAIEAVDVNNSTSNFTPIS